MSKILSFMTPTTTSSASSSPSLVKTLEPAQCTGEAVAIKPVEQPTVDKKLWEESLDYILTKHTKVFTALKDR